MPPDTAAVTLPEPESVPSLDTIEESVTAGLPMDSDRMECASANEDFYRGDQRQHLEAREAELPSDYRKRPKRFSRLTRKAIRTLTSLLYSPGPSRSIEGSEDEGGAEPSPLASTWLELVWRTNHIDRVMRTADRKATLNDCCAVQAVATGNPNKPITLYLWGGDEFTVFCRDDDPCCPWAVVTVQVITKGRKKWRHYEAWTAAEHRVYETKAVDWVDALPTAGGTAAYYQPQLSGTVDAERQTGDGLNPYGVLPFAFVWNERPVDRFWGSGVGTMLRECNEDIDRELSDTALHVKEFLNPKAFVRNVAVGTKLLDRVGAFMHLKPHATAAAGDNALEPDAFYLQAQLGVQDAWWDAQKYANQTFHELDVPLSAVRDDQQGPQSGFQVEAERGPLLDYTIARQPDFSEYEEEAARLILRVAGHYYDQPELIAAAETVQVHCAWTKPASTIRSAETDDHETHDLQAGVATRISILMDRGMTRAQAIARLEQFAEDAQEEARIFPEPDPVAAGVKPDGSPLATAATTTPAAAAIAATSGKTPATAADPSEDDATDE
jgi:hypothetical protein